MQAGIFTRAQLPKDLSGSIFQDRGSQFVDRLQWDLCVTPQGYEVDEYDDDQSEYLTIHHAGQHLGSCRVRPTSNSTMLTDHFDAYFPDARPFLDWQKGRVYELTRFCRAPEISVSESKIMLKRLAILLDEFRDRKNLTGYIAVVFPQVARFLDSIGVRYLILSRSKMDGKSVFLICITHSVKVTADQFGKPAIAIETSNILKMAA